MNIIEAIFWTGIVLISIGLGLIVFAPLVVCFLYGAIVAIGCAFFVGVFVFSSLDDKKQTK